MTRITYMISTVIKGISDGELIEGLPKLGTVFVATLCSVNIIIQGYANYRPNHVRLYTRVLTRDDIGCMI